MGRKRANTEHFIQQRKENKNLSLVVSFKPDGYSIRINSATSKR
jgi:hypothetical protein